MLGTLCNLQQGETDMPELPEVETVARTLAPHVLGWRVCAVDVRDRRCLHLLSLPLAQLEGLSIVAVRRRGKLLLLELADGQGGPLNPPLVLAVHLRMTGALLPHAGTAEGAPLPGAHTRCVFTLEDATGQCQWLFFDDIRTFGKLLLATPEILQRWPFWCELGPEPLETGVEEMASRLRGRRAIKAVLLDQTVLAGIGNIYADESLFAAGIDPRRKADKLSPDMVARLHSAMQAVLRQAIEQCGTSFRNYRDANGDAGAFQNQLLVYGQAGKPCPRCGRKLAKATVAGRGTVFCSRCQK